MATNSASVRNAGGPVHWSFARFADRRIFVVTGAQSIAATLGALVPESVCIMEAVRIGRRPCHR
jgi:hypothetical protein